MISVLFPLHTVILDRIKYMESKHILSFSKYLLSTYKIETVLAAEEVKDTDEDSTPMRKTCLFEGKGQQFCNNSNYPMLIPE